MSRNSKLSKFSRLGLLAIGWLLLAANPEVGRCDQPAMSDVQRKVKLAERDRLGSEASQLKGQGKYSAAIVQLRAVLALELELFGSNHPELFDTWNSIGACAELQEDWSTAESARDEALRMISTTLGKRDWRVTNARLARERVVRLKSMSPEDRRALQAAAKDDESSAAHFMKGNYAAAERPAQQVYRVYERLFGPEHPETATKINLLIVLYQSQGKHDLAQPLCQRVLNIREKSLGPNHPETATSLRNRAVLYGYKENFIAAEPLLHRALKITEEAFGPDHSENVASLSCLAGLYQSQGKYAAAEPLSQRALKIEEKTFGPDHWSTANRLDDLAGLFDMQGKYAAAEPLYQRALKIREKTLGSEHPVTTSSLDNLAGLYRMQGRYAAAEPLYQRALKIREKTLSPEHSSIANSLSGLAMLYHSQGKYAAAEPLYQRAIKIREKVFGPDHSSTAISVNNLAELYLSQGKYAAAEPLLLRAMKATEKALGPYHRDTATCLNSLGALYQHQGNPAAGVPLLQRALDVTEKALGSDHPETATALNNLAFLYQALGNYAAAEPLYQRALKIREKSLGPDHPRTGTTLNNLALLYKSQRNYAAAEPMLQRSLKITEKALGPDHTDTATSLISLGVLLNAQKKYSETEPLYQRALKIKEMSLGVEHPETATALNNLGMLSWYRKQSAAARPLVARGLKIQLRLLERTAGIQTEQQQLLMTVSGRYHLFSWLSVTAAEPTQVGDAFEPVLTWKGLTTTRQVRLRQALKNDPDYDQFRVVCQQLSTLTLNPPRPPSAPRSLAGWNKVVDQRRQEWNEKKDRLEREHERLEKALSHKSLLFQKDHERKAVTPAELQSALKQAKSPTAIVDLIEYGYFGREDEPSEWRLAAFIVRGTGDVQRVELGPTAPIYAQVRDWRTTFGRSVANREPGQKLRQQLWKPLERYLQGIDTVLISPDGMLAQLPWGALPGAKPGTYLIEERNLAVIPVPQLVPELLNDSHASGPPKSLLLAGDIEYGGTPGAPQKSPAVTQSAVNLRFEGHVGKDLSRLPGAKPEMDSIVKRYKTEFRAGRVRPLEGVNATEGAFCELAGQHQWLHVITHGFFAPDTIKLGLRFNPEENESLPQGNNRRKSVLINPGLLSGLAFAGASQPPEAGKADGILTALEVEALDLSKVDTVVLSACETGLGEVARGEGLLGLQRAFQVAGAKTVVASLWKVPDQATSLLMQRFYENLWNKKMEKLAALREAQLSLLRNELIPAATDTKGDSGNKGANRGLELVQIQPMEGSNRLPPYYWAAFVLSGDWR